MLKPEKPAESKEPAINRLLDTLPKPVPPAPVDWDNGEIECDTIQLDKPYGYHQLDSIAVGGNIDNRHGISGRVSRIVWVARSRYYRVHVLCATNPKKRVEHGDERFIIVPNAIGTTL